MIIAVDFDGTLQINNEPNMLLIDKLKAAQRKKDCVILWTCRQGKRLDEAIIFLARYGFKPDFINCNTPWVIKMLGYDPRKVLADIYIDDKAVN